MTTNKILLSMINFSITFGAGFCKRYLSNGRQDFSSTKSIMPLVQYHCCFVIHDRNAVSIFQSSALENKLAPQTLPEV